MATSECWRITVALAGPLGLWNLVCISWVTYTDVCIWYISHCQHGPQCTPSLKTVWCSIGLLLTLSTLWRWEWGWSVGTGMGKVVATDSRCTQWYNQDAILVQAMRQAFSHTSPAPTGITLASKGDSHSLPRCSWWPGARHLQEQVESSLGCLDATRWELASRSGRSLFFA